MSQVSDPQVVRRLIDMSNSFSVVAGNLNKQPIFKGGEGECLARAVLEASDEQVHAWVLEDTGEVWVERFHAVPTGEASARVEVIPVAVRQKRMRHMGVTKEVLIRSIRQWGTGDVLPGFKGTVDEAIAQVEADPREIFTGCECRKAADGSCLGGA